MSLELERALAIIKRQEHIDTLKAHVVALIDETNGGSEKDVADAIVQALRYSHRTLQQKFMGAVKLAITEYAKADHDLRNECAVKWAGEVAKIPNSDIRFPLI